MVQHRAPQDATPCAHHESARVQCGASHRLAVPHRFGVPDDRGCAADPVGAVLGGTLSRQVPHSRHQSGERRIRHTRRPDHLFGDQRDARRTCGGAEHQLHALPRRAGDRRAHGGDGVLIPIVAQTHTHHRLHGHHGRGALRRQSRRLLRAVRRDHRADHRPCDCRQANRSRAVALAVQFVAGDSPHLRRDRWHWCSAPNR